MVGNIGGETGIQRPRLWVVMKRFFATVADPLLKDNPLFAEKLRCATAHWMRHTHGYPCPAGRARIDHGARQPAPRFAGDYVDVPTLR